jgi:PIN domain nuclease of toxin-antitoxin system
VLDASALLAFLQHEKGDDVVDEAMDARDSRVTSVNYCEVVSKLFENGMPLEKAFQAFVELDERFVRILDFDKVLAARAASLRILTKPIGASLGDRACLACAAAALESGDLPTVYTTDRQWAKLPWPFKIIVIR